jgi:hypothetical protein
MKFSTLFLWAAVAAATAASISLGAMRDEHYKPGERPMLEGEYNDEERYTDEGRQRLRRWRLFGSPW